ncbi:MAG: phytanoyl-CoA dioxygenase family protein [Candidatus Latescibacterota bacterium]|nr:phytanoyl-CoA dioxygenase family protein [Candidatus Latescibacterota bacterium]
MWQIRAPECSRPEAARQETDAVQEALSYHTDMADRRMADQRLTDEQLRFFDTFGFLAFPGLLDDVITEIIDAFEEVWAQRGGGHNAAAHDDERRSCIVPFIDQHPRLCALLDDGRIHGMLCSLLGEDFNYTGSDGNYYAGDTQWHSDGFGRGGSQRFVKIAFYLDDLTRDTGCLRVIPGSHRAGEPFADTVQEHIRKIPDTWGVEGAGLPAVALETRPGNVAVFNHNLKHAAFGGSSRRRMFTINCCQRYPEADLPRFRDYISAHARFWSDRLYGETMMATAGAGRLVHLEQGMANDGHLAELAAKARVEMAEPSRG